MGSQNFINGGEGFSEDVKQLRSDALGPQFHVSESFGVIGRDEYLGVQNNKSLCLRLGKEVEEANKNSATAGKIGHTKLCVRGHWRPAEDAKLKELVAQFGPQNWNLIAEHLGRRSGKSCRLRWFNQLDPRINKMAFTEEEEERLLAAHEVYGNKWAIIAALFPGRTDNAVKNHYHVIQARKHREQSSVYRQRKSTSFQSLPKGLKLTQPNNATSESIISNTINDESAISTCTNLSLNPSSLAKPIHKIIGPSQMGLSDERLVTTGDVGFDEFFGGRHMSLGYPSIYSDSSSEVSVSESVATTNVNSSNLSSIFGESTENLGDDKINKPFIDFLGVGSI